MKPEANQSVRRVDQNELRTNQAFVIMMLVSAYIFDDWRMVAIQSGFFLLTTISLWLGPYVLIYRLLLKPLGIIKPDVRVDNPEPHRFATSVGFVVSGLAAYFLFNGATVVGWALAWLIVVLAGLAFAGWCAGCFSYYMLNRLGIGGFFHHGTVAEGFPGARPPR